MSTDRTDGDTIYRVVLVESGGGAGTSRAIATRDIRYYDSGVWVRQDEGRTFYPYTQIRRIEERSRADDEEPARDAASPDGAIGDWRDDANPNLGDDLGSDRVPADEL